MGTVNKSSIVEPIREFCHRTGTDGARFILASAESINFDQQVVVAHTADTQRGNVPRALIELNYDKLVIAVGAQPATFGIPGVEEHALFMKVDEIATICQTLMDVSRRWMMLLLPSNRSFKHSRWLMHSRLQVSTTVHLGL